MLKQKDVFEISQVSYAIFETNGKISVLLKPEHRNSTASDLNKYPKDKGMPFAVICDGKIASIGTSNLDYRSLYHHFENNVLLYGCEAVEKMAEDFEATFSQCREVTQKYTSGRGSMSVKLHGYRDCPLELGATSPRRSVDPLDTSKYILAARSALEGGIFDLE